MPANRSIIFRLTFTTGNKSARVEAVHIEVTELGTGHARDTSLENSSSLIHILKTFLETKVRSVDMMENMFFDS